MQELLLVNPRKRRSKRRASPAQIAARKRFAATYGGGRKRRRKAASSRRRRRYSSTAGVMQSISRGGRKVSRRAWRASGYRRNPRRRYRRNPIGLRLPTMRSVTNTVMQAAQGAVGATLVDMVMGQLATRGWLPQFTYTQAGYPITKGVLAIGTAALAEAVLPAGFRGMAAEMAKGSLTVTLAGVIRGFLPTDMPLGARRRRFAGMGYGGAGYIPSGRPRRALMGEYVSGTTAAEESAAYYPSYNTHMGEYLSR